MDPLKLEKGNGDWVKFHGKVHTEAQEGGQDPLDEYRDLVNRYFEELSRQGSQPGGK
jgi:hypothetical protein